MKTFELQDSFPSLPVPDLDDTLSRYLTSIAPHVSSSELKRAEEIVKAFGHGEGKALHQSVVERSKTHRNWLEEWWEYAAYLSYREPIAISVNMFTGMGSFTEFQLGVPAPRRAAEIIRYSMEYHHLLVNEKVPIEKMGGKHMCMNLFTRIFSSCRVPGDPADSFERYKYNEISHVSIFCRKSIFFLQVTNATTGELLTIGDLEEQLVRIKAHADYLASCTTTNTDEEVAAIGMGAMTGTDRISWSNVREELLDLGGGRNAQVLEKIQSSLFTLVLDNESPKNPAELIKNVCAGDSENRWFDKSVQYVVFQNGMVGANMEHGNADATVFMSMFRWLGQRYLQKSSGQDTFIESRTSAYLPPPEVATWTISSKIRTALANAVVEFNTRAEDFNTSPCRFKTFGKDWIKRHRLPPDSFIQMAMQLAYAKCYGTHCPTYESAHTRYFFHGRTETIRTCTAESISFVNAMLNKYESAVNKREKLQEAIDKHMELGMAALNGEGIDRHLLGMQVVSILSGAPKVPELYTDPCYSKSGGGGNFTFSTSNVSGYRWLWGGFAPMIKSGLGVCYDIESDFCGFMITSYKSGGKIQSSDFEKALVEGLHELKAVVEEVDAAHSKL